MVFYSPLSCIYIIFICFYTSAVSIPVNITFEGCSSFPLHCEAISTKGLSLTLYLQDDQQTVPLHLLHPLRLADLLWLQNLCL